MTKLAVPPGYALVRLDDLAALLAHNDPAPQPPPPAPGATWQALAASVALITDKLGGTGASHADVIGDLPPESVVRVLVILTAATLAALSPDKGTALLRDLGLLALGEGAQ